VDRRATGAAALLQVQAAQAAEEAAAQDRGRSHEAALAARVSAGRECDARQHAEHSARAMQQARLRVGLDV
jgi:hypothetical protein